MLDFIPHYAEKLPIIAFFLRRERKRFYEFKERELDFSTAYWLPPMPPESVYEIEKKQIETSGLNAIVSITDHDNIDGNLRLNKNLRSQNSPISLEWTVPFDYGFFHLGIHNLPKAKADHITQTLLKYTFKEEAPDNSKLHDLFAMLDEMKEVLIVLNHPLWDIELVGQDRHDDLLKAFINEHGHWIHAFEINGFRTWTENKAVIEMANECGFPVTTGGDRHGCKPNTVINLTDSASFSEFVEEIRVDKKSEVVLMPEYKLPLHSRQLQSFSEILSSYSDVPDNRQRWMDRVFFDIGDEKGLVSLTEQGWGHGGPIWLRIAIKTLGFMGSPAMRPFFSLARNKMDRVPKAYGVKELESAAQTKPTNTLPSDQKRTKTGFAS